MERSTDEDDGGHQPSSVPLNISSDEESGSAAVVVPPPKKKQQQAITSMFHATSGMALRKSRVRDFGGLVVRRFAYAKPVCVRDSRWREKSRRVRKSRTQNRVAYANRVRKSRT